MPRKSRLAIVVSHPIQYHSPWFAHLAALDSLELKVFYLWDFGITDQTDRGFGVVVQWDIPLLDGYDFEFVPNVSDDPGTHHFSGLNNPTLVSQIVAWAPHCILLFGFNFLSHQRLLWSWILRRIPILIRGDSHNLGRSGGLRSIIARFVRRLIFSRCAGFLTVGKANSDYFQSHIDRPIFQAAHFVDNDRFRLAVELNGAKSGLRQKPGIPANALLFGFVGKFEEKKRPVDIITATNELLPLGSGRTAAFVFVGAGVLESQLKKAAADRLGKDVFLLPFQNQAAMPDIYAMLDFIVLPSAHSETWGLCINEAMNCAVVPIVSDVVGCGPDLVSPGQTGWVFKHADVGSLRSAILSAAQLPDEERLRMARACQHQIERYSVENASDALLRAVASLAA